MNRLLPSLTIVVLFVSLPLISPAQAVTGIVTDFNSYWKSSTSAINPVKPDNSHNLLAFTFNGVQYSTGANDNALVSHGETFSSQDFWSLPIANISGNIIGNTKVGLGEKYDGIHAGPGLIPPIYGISMYLTDGIKGLDIGTCVANLPSGNMTFFVNSINPANIGDGVPDILVTQVADPSGSTDVYEMIDSLGARVGNSLNITFQNIAPVGNWTADFYEALHIPLSLTNGFTNTDRPLRLWAADLSDFGITSANYERIKNFKINLSGNSDVAFAAYNRRSISLLSSLPVSLTQFKGAAYNKQVKLEWQTASESNTAYFDVERSSDAKNFSTIGKVNAAFNSNSLITYTFTDTDPAASVNYYRLKTLDIDGKISYSDIIMINLSDKAGFSLYPNPAKDNLYVNYPASRNKAVINIYNAAGSLQSTNATSPGSLQSTISISNLSKGVYFLVVSNENDQYRRMFVKQ